MVRHLPYNWKRIDGGDLIGTVEYAPVESMHRAGCCGEARLWWLAPRGIASLGNCCGVMTMIAYLTLWLPSPHLRRHCSLPFSWRKDIEKRGRRRRKEKEKKDRGDAILHPLSPRSQSALLVCLLCWRSFQASTVMIERQKCLCAALLKSVLMSSPNTYFARDQQLPEANRDRHRHRRCTSGARWCRRAAWQRSRGAKRSTAYLVQKFVLIFQSGSSI